MKKSNQKILAENAKAIATLPNLFNAKGKYKQTSEAEYDTYITGLNWSDLERHASSVGVIPSVRASKNVLLEKLRKKFIMENAATAQSNVKTASEEKSVLTKNEEELLNKFFSRLAR